jgi:DNA-binding PadR family transcriptional regulator
MKGFLFAVSQLPELPRTMLFYNGGASLTCKGSGSLEDLKSLEAEGCLTLSAGEDRRTRVITLTEKGADLARRTADRIIQAEQAAFQAMEPEEAEAFLRLFKQYVDHLEAAEPEPESGA